MRNQAMTTISTRALAAAALLAGCTNTGLHRDLGPPAPPPKDTINVEGTFCTEDPETLKFPVKVWFIIDDSGSMGNADPNQNRYTAATQLAADLEDVTEPDPTKRSMYFGASRFADNGASGITVPRFTSVAADFTAQINAVANAGNGGTPYTAALSHAFGELSADVNEDPTLARRTRYVVIFLSDGVPNGPGDPEGIIPGVENLMSLRDRAGDVTVNTVYLGGGGGDNAQAILMEMANVGQGLYKSFPNGDALDYSDFDFSSIRRNYNQRFFMLSNINSLASIDGQFADSDQDGIADYREEQIGTDPGLRDTDSDGCGDLFETRDAGWDPLIPGTQNNECVCTTDERVDDTDGDGLTDCEEKWIGSSSIIADADRNEDDTVIGDLVWDGWDHKYLNDVLFPNDGMDFDADGVQDLAELRTHTDPHGADKARDDWAYRYVYVNQQPDNPRCYDFRVENISIMPTIAADGRAAGDNEIVMYFAQSPQDNAQKEKSFRIARVIVNRSNMQDLTVAPEDFDEYITADPTTGP